MDDQQFFQLLAELMEKIDDGPGSHADALAKIAEQHTAMKELKEFIVELGDSLGTVRIIVKYLMFDLEATRRERDQLRMSLEDQD